MPIDLTMLIRYTEPSKTTLIFGAGSSIPSGGLTGVELSNALRTGFKLSCDETLNLQEISTLVEKQFGRRSLIETVQKIIKKLSPTGAILNLPLYSWKSIYTTNYDTLIEQSFEKSSTPLSIFKSNFDFGSHDTNLSTKLFKIHGCIKDDVALGSNSRIIITEADYDKNLEYRELLFRNLQVDMAIGNVLIIGHSLSDADLKELVNEAIKLKRQSGAPGKISLLLNVKDLDRATLFEEKGLEVCFGSIDDFFSGMTSKDLNNENLSMSADPLDSVPILRPTTFDVSFEMSSGRSSAIQMFNGQTASYADLVKGLCFERDVSNSIENFLTGENGFLACIIGAAGVGKTTAARQILSRLTKRSFSCWEHKDDFTLESQKWLKLAGVLKEKNIQGALLIDDCHNHMREVNDLIDGLARSDIKNLKLILTSSKPHWNPRMKSPIIFTSGKIFDMSQLSAEEINSLISLFDREDDIRTLVESKFRGFSRPEQRRRLEDRCGADMFVCLKNIFGFDKIDDIILKEYAELPSQYQDIYRTVAAMEAAGVKVHRQLIVRTLGIQSDAIAQILDNLTDIINEYTIDEVQGLYGWKGRHFLIAQTLADYKFSDQNELYSLFERIIDNLNPAYDLEIRTLAELCDRKHGLGKIRSKDDQNYLLRKMISLAPSQRVPRHRLIQNMISERDFDTAEAEIRIFESELKLDAPVQRYKINMLLYRAQETSGIMQEDRAAIVRKAVALAEEGVRRFSQDKFMYREYCTVGLAYLKFAGDWSVFDEAVSAAKAAEERIMDPELTGIISSFETRGQRIQRGVAA